MSNKKKLKSKDGATRIVPMAGGAANLYGVQYYDDITESWEGVEGLYVRHYVGESSNRQTQLRYGA